MDPCSFQDKTNPLTKQKCKESFSNINSEQLSGECVMPKIPDDFVAQAYFASVGLFGIYLMYRYMVKMGLVPVIKI
jgi:hypothetical protein